MSSSNHDESLRKYLYGRFSQSFQHRKLLVLVICLLSLNVIQSLVIWRLVVHQSHPFVLVRDHPHGVRALSLKNFEPSTADVSYFIRLWVSRLLTVDARHIHTDLKFAASWVRGQANHDLYRWIQKDQLGQNLSRDQTYSRSVTIQSLVLGGYGTSRYADINVVLLTNMHGTAHTEKKSLHIEYFLLPPRSFDKAENNPLGLYITHFVLMPTSPTGIII